MARIALWVSLGAVVASSWMLGCAESGTTQEAGGTGGIAGTSNAGIGGTPAGGGGTGGSQGGAASSSAGAGADGGKGGTAGTGGVAGTGGGGVAGTSAGSSGGKAGAGGANGGSSGAWGNTTTCAETLVNALTELSAGMLLDARDGRAYRTVQIGGQQWMAENLDFGTRVDGATGQVDDGAVEKYCVDDCDDACAALGGLYTYAEALGLPSRCNDEDCTGELTDPERGICPEGWHVPDGDEWNTLEATVEAEVGQNYAGRALRSDEGWLDDPVLGGNGNGTDDYDFRVLPVGVYSVSYSAFGALGELAYFWAGTGAPGGVSTGRIFRNGQRSITSDSVTKVQGISVRCVAD